MSSCDNFNMTLSADLMLSVITGTLGGLGAPGNLFFTFLILSEYKTRRPHDWLFFLLALDDFFLCVNSMAFEAPFIIRSTRVECKFAAAFFIFCGGVSLLTPPLIAYNRYLSLYDNPRCQRLFTNRNVFIAWGVIVIIFTSLVIAFAVFDGLGRQSTGLCTILTNNHILKGCYAFVSVLIGAANSLLVYFTVRVVMKIMQHKKSASQSQLQSQLVMESQEIITALILSSVAPLLAQIPGPVVHLIELFTGTLLNPWLTRASLSPWPLPSALNSYVTMYMVKEYRKKIIRMLKRSGKVAPAPAAPADQLHPTGAGRDERQVGGEV